jgi:hypothetical protein
MFRIGKGKGWQCLRHGKERHNTFFLKLNETEGPKDPSHGNNATVLASHDEPQHWLPYMPRFGEEVLGSV